MAKLKNIIRRYTSIPAVIDILRRKELPLLDPQNWDDRNDRYFMKLYKESKNLDGIYALCAAACSETYHHWRVFTNGTEGACIELNRQLLEQEISKIDGVRFGEIDYITLEQVEKFEKEDIEKIPFLKRIAFSPECEYRIVLESNEIQKSSFSIKISENLINRIYLNPWLPESISNSVKETFRTIPGWEKIHISKSFLIESNRWKTAGNKILGISPSPRNKHN